MAVVNKKKSFEQTVNFYINLSIYLTVFHVTAWLAQFLSKVCLHIVKSDFPYFFYFKTNVLHAHGLMMVSMSIS